ncbi:MAG: hypothetical protein OEY64_03085 [Nitrospinota bacterium]|nr:hypothetical protein [Nitrospinota bacterium]
MKDKTDGAGERVKIRAIINGVYVAVDGREFSQRLGQLDKDDCLFVPAKKEEE